MIASRRCGSRAPIDLDHRRAARDAARAKHSLAVELHDDASLAVDRYHAALAALRGELLEHDLAHGVGQGATPQADPRANFVGDGQSDEHLAVSGGRYGAGAEEFALTRGVALVPRSYFYTEARWRQLERLRSGEAGLSPLTISHVGTVGAVAADAAGRLAAATSTGGMTGKRFGRIGDSPIIGAGTYADDRSCAVSATGHGEVFIRAAVAHDICARMRFGGRSVGEAARQVIFGELAALGGEGGVIAIDAHGEIAMEFNSEGMFRASRKQGEAAHIAIYRP